MKVGERGRITIPKALRGQYGIDKDVEVELIPEKVGIRIRKLSSGVHSVGRVRGIAKMKYANSVDEYIREIRGE
jgi:bifunctional DNA-binding transcriptional regulator/antitoxin component of YhaV-PrlF toxin-antitoxin module